MTSRDRPAAPVGSRDVRPFQLGPFRAERPIGRGGMATVWRGRHVASDTPVAIKIIDRSMAREQRFREAFAREVRSVARLEHPAVVRVFDHGGLDAAAAAAAGQHEGAPYLVMEFLGGGPLITTQSAPLEWPAVYAMLEVVLDALAHAHARGVVHRDLKPDNILLGDEGPVLTDFGLAYRPGHDRDEGAAAGTAGYMAPEQVKRDWVRFGPATDLYAVGCIAWQALCGAPPHVVPGRPPLAIAMAQLQPTLPRFTPAHATPAGLERWLGRMLAVAPEDRYAFAAEALAALRAIAAGARATPPTLPADWRVGQPPPRAAALVGVGRALFGHRIWPPVGRPAARDALWSALASVLSTGRPRGVIVEGPSGQGKTHLVEWLAERAHQAGVARVMHARHSDQGLDGGPAGGLGPMVARFLGVPQAQARRALPVIRALPALRGAPSRRAVEVAAFASADGTCRDGEVEVQLDRPARIALFGEVLAALASRGPIVVVLDDVQWGLATLRAIDRVLAHSDLPVLFLMTVRTDVIERGSPARARLDTLRGRSSVDAITIGPLAPAAHRQVVRAMLPVADSLVDALVDRAEGSPLFAVELLRYFIAAGLLEEGPSGYRLADGSAQALPDQLQVLWRVRLAESLGGEVEAMWPALEVAAALGTAVDLAEWRAVCAARGITAPRLGMKRLLDSGLIRAEVGGWAFSHVMLPETVAAASREEGRWVEVNRQCAEVLAGRDAAPLRLAEHYLAAEQPAAAVAPLEEATFRLIIDGEADAASRLISRRIGLLRALGAGRSDARWQMVRLHLARLDKIRGRFARAARRARQVHRIAEQSADARHLARALYIEGDVAYHTESPERSIELYIAGIAAARRDGDPILLSAQLTNHASALTFVGRLDEAEAALREAWQCLGDGPQPRRRGTVLYYLAGLHAYREQTEEGIARCRAARMAFGTAGSRHLEALTWSMEGDLERRAGALERAAACYDSFRSMSRLHGPWARFYPALYDGLQALAHGRYAVARHALELAAAEQVGSMQGMVEATRLACVGGQGDWAEWDAIAAELSEVLARTATAPDVPWAMDIAAAVADQAGYTQRAAFARKMGLAHRVRMYGLAASSPDR